MARILTVSLGPVYIAQASNYLDMLLLISRFFFIQIPNSSLYFPILQIDIAAWIGSECEMRNRSKHKLRVPFFRFEFPIVTPHSVVCRELTIVIIGHWLTATRHARLCVRVHHIYSSMDAWRILQQPIFIRQLFIRVIIIIIVLYTWFHPKTQYPLIIVILHL